MIPRKILIIEDEPEIRMILRVCLSYAGRFEPVAACDGIEGVEIAQLVRPDLILLDAVMPRMDGYATCRLIKNDPELKNTPVVFLTAKTDQREVDRAIRAGACGCIPKPFDPLTLADQIDRLCEETKTS